MSLKARQDFAVLLRELRKAAGFRSQVDLAAAVDVGRSTISKAENPKNGVLPGEQVLNSILDVLRSSEVSREDLDRLQRLWLEGRRKKPEPPRDLRGPSDRVLQRLEAVLEQWPSGSAERQALSDEMELYVANWESYSMAVSHLTEGAQVLARSSFEHLLNAMNVTGDQYRLRSRVLYGLGKALRYFREWDQAQRALTQALEIASELDDRRLQAEILLLGGDVERRRYNLDAAVDYYKRAEQVIDRLDSPRTRARYTATAKRKQAAALLFQGRALKALELCEESILLSTDAGSLEDKLKAQQHKAWALAMLGRWDAAIQMHKKAYEELSRFAYPLWKLAKAKRYYADALRMSGHIDEAESLYLSALHDLTTHGSRILSDEEEFLVRGPIRWGLGNIYRTRGELRDAKRYLLESEHLSEAEPFYYAQAQSELAKIALEEEDYQEAERLFREALDTFQFRNNTYYVTAMMVNMAELELRRNQPEKALDWLDEVSVAVQDDPDLVIHRLRSFKWSGRAKLATAVDEELVVDQYCAACRIAAIDLDNPHLFEELATDLLGAMFELRSSNQADRLQRLYSRITAWRTKMPPAMPEIEELFDSWLGEVEQLCSG